MEKSSSDVSYKYIQMKYVVGNTEGFSLSCRNSSVWLTFLDEEKDSEWNQVLFSGAKQ